MLKMDSDASFLEKLYTEKYSMVYKFVVHSLRDHGFPKNDAPDIVQEVFVLAAKNVDKLRNRKIPEAWLMKTAKYMCMNYASAYARHREQLFESLDLHADHEDAYSGVDTIVSLEQILKPEEYALLKAYYIERRPTEEICRETGFTPGLLRVRMHRLKKYLSAFFVFLVIFASSHNI